MSRLLNALRSCSSAPRRTVHPVSEDLRADINWWQYFLSQYNGVSVIPSDVIVSNPELFAMTRVSPVAVRFVSASVFTESFRISFSPKKGTLTSWNCSPSSSQSNCGLPSYRALESSFSPIIPVACQS